MRIEIKKEWFNSANASCERWVWRLVGPDGWELAKSFGGFKSEELCRTNIAEVGNALVSPTTAIKVG